MMRGLVDVDAFEHRMPRWNQQARFALPEFPFTEDAVERREQLSRVILAAQSMTCAPPALPDPISKDPVLLIENRRPLVFV